jgi:oligopeptidase A
MESSGVGLEGEVKEKFNNLQLQAAELSTKFSNNILDSTKQFKLVLSDKELIKGLPDSAVAFATQQAISNGYPNATKENGPWILTLDMPSYLPSMQNLENREIREKLYRAYITRASSGEFNNAEIIPKILQIKSEIAHILGYRTHAEKSLSKKMASSVDEVLSLIEMLRVKSYPAAEKEMAELQEFAKSRGFIGNLQLWDIPFWSERFREYSYDYKEEELKEYFAMPNVLNGLFTLANRLFNIIIEEPSIEERKNIQLWHPDVKFFNIKDATSGEYIASFYLDPYSRPQEKRGGAWMDSCLGRSRVKYY